MLLPCSPKFTAQEIALLIDLVFGERGRLIEHVRANDPYPVELLSAANSKLHALDALGAKLAAVDTVHA